MRVTRLFKGLEFAICAMWVSACSTQPTPNESLLDREVEQFLAPFIDNGDFSGIVAVSQRGEQILNVISVNPAAAKLAQITPGSSFHIASLSKTFTALAIKKLIDADLLSIDQSLEIYLPEYPAWKDVSIRQLLAHRSGIPDYWALEDVTSKMQQEVTLPSLVSWLHEQSLDFPPGARESYSNSGYAVLALLIERVSQRTYHDFVKTEILDGLKLTDTRLYERDTDIPGFVPGFDLSGISLASPYDPSILIGAGSFKSTASDLLDWCEHFNTEFIHQPDDAFLYGWGVRQEDEYRWVEQSGRNPGFAAHLRAYPDQELCLIVLSQIESEATRPIAQGVADLVLGSIPMRAEKRPRFDLTPEAAEAIVGLYEIAPGNNLAVRNTASGLILAGRNGPELPLEPIAPDRFFYRQLFVEIDVSRDSSGDVDALLWGGDFRIRRLE